MRGLKKPNSYGNPTESGIETVFERIVLPEL